MDLLRFLIGYFNKMKIDKRNDRTEKRTHNSRFAKAGVLCFYESEVLNSSFVHLMKFSAENPRLRKAAKRYDNLKKHDLCQQT